METQRDRQIGHDGLPLTAQTKLQNDAKETRHLDRVCESFRQYATFTRCARGNLRARVEACPDAQRKYLPPSLLPGTAEAEHREKEMRRAEVQNQFLFDMILKHSDVPTSQEVLQTSRRVSTDDEMSKVSSVLKSLARDWSDDGAAERNPSYGPILCAFRKYLPTVDCAAPPRVVVPGAGVGRLALELCSRGYETQGNEFSFPMLLASDFILNGGCTPKQPFTIYPYITETCNLFSYRDAIKEVKIPDCNPPAMLSTSKHQGDQPPEFSMAAGEFTSIYQNEKEKEKWDGVASCFFLDTAPNVCEYFQTIHHMLKDGGLLINFGPWHWHWTGPPQRPDDLDLAAYRYRNSHIDKRYLDSIDMSWDDVKEVLSRVGFDIVEEKRATSLYTSNPRSMKRVEYRCIFFVARKRASNL